MRGLCLAFPFHLFLWLQSTIRWLTTVGEQSKTKYHDLDLEPPGCSRSPAACAQPHGGCPCLTFWSGHLGEHKEPGEGFFCSSHPKGEQRQGVAKASSLRKCSNYQRHHHGKLLRMKMSVSFSSFFLNCRICQYTTKQENYLKWALSSISYGLKAMR